MVWLTDTPVIAAAGSFIASAAPELTAMPCTVAFVFNVTVLCSVAVPVAIVGRATVPAGGVMPITASKLAPVTC